MATKSSSSPAGTTATSEAIIVLSSELSPTTASPAASTATTPAAETSIETKLALGLRLTGESTAMSSSKARRAESLRLLTKVIETWGKGSKLSHLVTVGLTLVLLET